MLRYSNFIFWLGKSLNTVMNNKKFHHLGPLQGPVLPPTSATIPIQIPFVVHQFDLKKFNSFSFGNAIGY